MSVQSLPWPRPFDADGRGAERQRAGRTVTPESAPACPGAALPEAVAAQGDTGSRPGEGTPRHQHRTSGAGLRACAANANTDGALPPPAFWPWAAATLLMHGVVLVAMSMTWPHKTPASTPAAGPASMQWVAVRPLSFAAPAPPAQEVPRPPAPKLVGLTSPALPIPHITISDPQKGPAESGSPPLQAAEPADTTRPPSPEEGARPPGIEARVATASPRASPPDASEQPASFPANHQQCRDTQTARFYPALLRDRGVQGLVRLRVKVDDNGRAAEVLIAAGSGFRLLDEAARQVAESCPYVPARQGGQRVSSWIEYAVRFALSPPSPAL